MLLHSIFNASRDYNLLPNLKSKLQVNNLPFFVCYFGVMIFVSVSRASAELPIMSHLDDS
jgi:hypothetical protein